MLVRRYYDRADMKVKIDGKIFHAPQPLVPLDEKIEALVCDLHDIPIKIRLHRKLKPTANP